MHRADELEDGMGCAAIPVATAEFPVLGSHVPCRGAGAAVRPVKEGLGLAQLGRRHDDACETWLEDAFKSSLGCCWWAQPTATC